MEPASEEARNLAVVRGYYAAIAQGAAGVDWERWFAPDVVQEEFPIGSHRPGLAATSTA